MKSLRAKMTILIALVVLASSGLLLMVSYRRALNSMSSQLEQNYTIAADKYAQELTALINTNATMIDTLATEITVSRIFEKSYEDFHKYLEVSFEIINKKGYIYDIYFTYPDNHMACASDFIADGSMDYVHDREWYTAAAKTGELFYSTPYLDSDSGLPIVTISKAVYTDGKLQGVLAADIFVDILVDIISKAEVEPDSYAFLIDQNMGMIVHPNDAYSFDDQPLGVLDISDALYDEVISNIMSNSKKTVYLKDYDGVTRGIVVSRMENTGWYVGIATSKDEIMEGTGGLIRGFVIAAIAAVVLGGIFAFFLAYVLDKLSRQQRAYEAEVLRLEKKAADEANKAKSAFLADMSHEIRTPINAILGMNEMIIRETGESDVLEYARNIKNSGSSLLQLINSILDFSKIEGGKMEIVPVRYSTENLIADLINSMKERATAKNLEFLVNIDPSIPSELFGDDLRIEQIILNMLSNAVKYTSKGCVKLTMENKEIKEDSVLLYVEVSDTGMGIKESDMERLFESFERLDTIKNRNIEGTGLGMSITTKLLSLMGSELKVRSKYGEGSVFYFEIWQKIEERKPLGEYKISGTKKELLNSYHESFRAPNAHILVVDDTKMNITVVINLLKTTEIKIDTAENGEKAVKMADVNCYDVILLDQRMPGMDGVETLKAIRNSEAGKNAETPVICLTADAIRGAREKYIAEGYSDYLTKPVDGEALENMLVQYLPQEKVVKRTELEKTGKIASDEKILSLFDASGINTDVGMKYCQDDISFYLTILCEYAKDYNEKKEKLQKYKAGKNWKDYSILIHAVKSSSKTIGATELSEKALALEIASKDNDIEKVEKEHDETMQMYKSIVGVINNALDKIGFTSDDEIIEFSPNKE